MGGICFVNDSQVVDQFSSKRYGSEAFVLVEIWSVE